MIQVKIQESILKTAAESGMDEFMQAIVDAIMDAIGGVLNAETMPMLNSDQITLLAYSILRDEVMDGGFVQLIHNGYGRFIFINPFDKAIAQWGLTDLSRMIKKAHKAYNKYHKDIEIECDDDEFMAMFERMPEFDDLDDEFVSEEERYTAMVAYYIDEHLEAFVEINSEE